MASVICFCETIHPDRFILGHKQRVNIEMASELSFSIGSSTQLCSLVREAGFSGLSGFWEFARYVEALPYGRVSDDENIASVLLERRGTCSSKHRLLAGVAHDCVRTEIQLTVGICLMSEANTPGVGKVLSSAGLDSIPEAHCYLTFAGKRFDFTGLSAGSSSPFEGLLEEHFIQPSDLPSKKVLLHKLAIANWAALKRVSPDDAWQTREQCIAVLAADISLRRKEL